ncbi:MAG TPA: response regulator [Anaerolineaceae bacterium]
MKPKTILLVEDDLSDIKLTKKAFEKSHLVNQLVIVQDGQEALEYLFANVHQDNQETHEHPALVLLDLRLPKIDGLEVLRQIRLNQRTCLLPVVILTTSREEQDLLRGYELGANSYIQKPIDPDQFFNAIQQLGMYWLVLNEEPPEVVI